MKAITRIQTWIGLFACSLIGLAQESPSIATTNTPPGGGPATPTAVAPVTAAPEAAAPAAVTPAAAAPEAAAPAAVTPAATVPAAGAVIPLIQYVDVPLTTAIENLARQAGINYILDYKVPYGQLGPDGRPQPQPSLTIRWENLTAEQALNAVLNNYDLQLIEDPKTKISRITRKDPAAPPTLITRTIQLKYANPSNVVAAVQAVLVDKRSHVVPDIRTSQMVVTAPESELDAVDALIARLDTQTKQVLIEAKLLETVFNPSTSKGVDWSGTLGGQNISFGNGVVQQAQTLWQSPGVPYTLTYPGGRTVTVTPSSSGATASGGTPVMNGVATGTSSSSSSSSASALSGGLIPNGMSLNTLSGLTPNIGFLNADGVHAVLSFLNQSADTKVLSEPRTVTLDNEMAALEVVEQYPVVNITAGTANTTGGASVGYTNVGVKLKVTPHISANNYVSLKVVPEVSAHEKDVSYSLGQGSMVSVPVFTTRTMETTVLIPSGNTLVMGGMLQDQIIASSTKVPVLGDIPVLGYAFHSNSKARQKTKLLIFITPTIVQDTDFQPARSDFLKTPAVQEMEPEWSAWDSGKPLDWSKLNSRGGKSEQPVFDESLVTPKAQ